MAEPPVFRAPPRDATAAQAEAVLRGADWTAFDAGRDLVPLRSALAALEAREGVTDAHRFATARLREGGALLRHPDGHQAELTSHALSPDGRYLAVGSWTGDDYERGGGIQIWELATGRCVNMLDGVFGGQGWPDYHDTLQWSADGRTLASEFNTNMVGSWDPFGERVHPPRADVGLAGINGASRPVGFALHPEGDGIFLHHGDWDSSPENGVWGCLAPLRRSNFSHDYRDPEPVWMNRPAADVLASLGGAALSPDASWFSADGRMIWGFGERIRARDDGPVDYEKFQRNRRSGAFAIDVARRELVWVVDSAFNRLHDRHRIAVSPDESVLAVNHGETLAFLDPATGDLLAETAAPFESPHLVWGRGEHGPRLAVIDAEDGGGVHVFDGLRLHHELRLKPQRAQYDFPDGRTWAWSPGGERAACLTADGTVEVVDLVDAPHTITVLEAPEDARGLWWGAGEVLVTGGPGSLRFHDLRTRRVLGDFRFGREVPRQRPLWDDTEDLGQEFRPNPTFALDEDKWVVALPEGVVIAQDTDQSVLDEQLCWAVDRRHSWPYRWGEAPLVPDVAACFDKLTSSRELLEPLRDRVAGTDAPGEWPPPNTAGIDELYDVMIESVLAFDGGWTMHVADAVRHAAKQRARAGQPEAAESLIALIPPDTENDHLRAQAEVGLILAAAGEHGFARRLLADAARGAAGLDDHTVPYTASALGAGLTVLGDGSGQAWIDTAIAAIDPYPNPWQHRISVIWALLEAGLEDQARALWTEGEPGSPFHQSSWLAHLVRIGRDDLVREFAIAPDRPWSDNHYAWTVFSETGRPDLLREWFVADGRDPEDYRDDLAAAEANAATDRPNAADLADLRERYEALQRMPLSQRREDTKRLAWRAAACGHYGAVLDLLRLLPMDLDFNDRAATSERALWTALTGVDGDPW